MQEVSFLGYFLSMRLKVGMTFFVACYDFETCFYQNYRAVCDKNKVCDAVDKNCLLILKCGFFPCFRSSS